MSRLSQRRLALDELVRWERWAGTRVAVRIFLAGASEVLGVRVVPLLVANGHVVAGMTRSPGRSRGPGRPEQSPSSAMSTTQRPSGRR